MCTCKCRSGARNRRDAKLFQMSNFSSAEKSKWLSGPQLVKLLTASTPDVATRSVRRIPSGPCGAKHRRGPARSKPNPATHMRSWSFAGRRDSHLRPIFGHTHPIAPSLPAEGVIRRVSAGHVSVPAPGPDDIAHAQTSRTLVVNPEVGFPGQMTGLGIARGTMQFEVESCPELGHQRNPKRLWIFRSHSGVTGLVGCCHPQIQTYAAGSVTPSLGIQKLRPPRIREV